MNTIINSQVINQSRFVLEEIKEKMKVYVQNASFFEAEQILRDHHYIVISGIPGIGKTTLAEILVFNSLAKGVEEFVYLSDTILSGFRLFNPDRSQIFLFDDFLGSNFLHTTIGTNDEMQILKFIAQVKASPNKLLVFTTREYILNQAKQKFERFEQTNFVKCILDLSRYTVNIKAKILYNHLYLNHIPYSYINEVIHQDCLMKIIEHKNYSPRIIENFSKREFWERLKPKEFPKAVIRTFDLPFSIWEHAYEHQISILARIILLNMTICAGEVKYTVLYEQVKKFGQISKDLYLAEINEHTFKFAVKELDNSFLVTNQKRRTTIVKFQNPSIRDFLLNYLNSHEEIIGRLIRSALSLNDLLGVFSNKRQFAFSERTVLLTDTTLFELEKRIINDFDNMAYSIEDFGFNMPKEDDIAVLKLFVIKQTLGKRSEKLFVFMRNQMVNLLNSENIGPIAVIPFVELITFTCSEADNLELPKILCNLQSSILDEESITILGDFEQYFPRAFNDFRSRQPDTFRWLFSNIIDSKLLTYHEDTFKIQGNINDLEELGLTYGVDFSDEREQLQEEISRINEVKEQINLEYFVNAFPEDEAKIQFDGSANQKKVEESKERSKRYLLTEKEKIENIFKSLG